MNVKNRALVIVGFLIVSFAVFFVVQGITEHNSDIEESIREEEKIIDETVGDIQQYAYEPYRARISSLVERNPALREAFARRDRKRLYQLTDPIYQDLHKENGYLHAMGFSLPDGTVFLRVQDPALFGDRLDLHRPVANTVHREQKQLSGYDIGRHGIMYWIVEPIFDQGRYIGALEIGIEAQQVTFALADRFRSEVTIAVSADIWKKANMVAEGFRRFGRYVVLMGPGSIYTQLPDTIDLSQEQDVYLELNNKPHVLHVCSVLRDFAQDEVGKVLIAQDLSAKIADRKEFVRRAVAVTIALLASSLVFLYLSFDKLIGKLEVYAEENKRAREEVEAAKEGLELRVQDRTRELEQANIAIKEQHRFLQTIIESLSHPFYVIDADTYKILLANRAAYGDRKGDYHDLTCHEMTHGRTIPCSGEEHPCAVRSIRTSKQPALMEHVHVDTAGRERINEIYAYPIMSADGKVEKIVEYCIDITERKQADEEMKKMAVHLSQMQKMEAIGALAGGIAHDFNNILAGMLGYADLARHRITQNPQVQDMLEKVIEGGDRAKKLVQQILSFSRQAEQKLAPVKAQDIVREAMRLLRASIPTTIEIKEDIDPGCGDVLADPTQIHQIVMNLCTNAYHAMREKGGVLGVAVRPVRVGLETHRTASSYLAPGDYIRIEVADTGHGMRPEVLKRIFEPYYTTKEHGEGTGLGLAVVHGIAKSHGGHVTVYSEPGVGTTFNIYLPQYRPPGEPAAGPESSGDLSAALPSGTERILLVDDEPQLAEMGAQILEGLGYRVAAFTDSMAALHEYQARPDEYDLVLTDMTMPNLTGVQLARQILALRPSKPIILCTGFSEMINAKAAREIGVRKFVMKPLLLGDIAKVVRAVLDER